MNLNADERWVDWWCNPWQWAHPAWRNRFADASGLSMGECDALMATRHGAFLQSLGIAPGQPPVASEPILHWLSLTPRQREQAIALAQRICYSRNEADGPDGSWCLGFSKALRPEAWLDFRHEDARLLLGAWLGPEYWPRLRLAWPPGEVGDSPVQAPENKLRTLWQAVLWRVTAS
ncbi:type III secretion protein [Pseudomonas syringae]|uniref:type III secretion protein n=1 Tax=Pseudomonas syringae TaxID=317 RepID=UPI001CA86805|nr:type III secretion protein [Pseudomonas syringae]MCI3944152.1 type III secretion protein [Pseudomonas syringae]